MSRSAALLVAVALLVAPAASAQGLQNSLLAETLFKDGQEMMKAGKYDEACSKFTASFKIDPAAGTALNLAACQEKAGRLASAWIAYTEASALFGKSGKKDREQFAKGKAAALQPRLNRLKVLVTAPAPGQEIRFDGVVLPPELWGTAMPVDSGKHSLEASAPGKVAWSAQPVVAAGVPLDSVTVPALAAVPAPVVATADPVPAPSPDPVVVVPPPPPMTPVVTKDATRTSSGRIAGFAIGGVGIAGLAAGAGMLVSAKGLANERDALCAPGTPCRSQEAFNKDHDARVMQQWGLVAGGVGIAAVGVGLALVLLKGDEPVEAAPAPESESESKKKKHESRPDEFSLGFGASPEGFQVVLGGVF